MAIWSATILLALAAPIDVAPTDPSPPAPSVAVAPETLPFDPTAKPIDKSGFSLFDPTPRIALRDFTTDRPDATESPFTVDAGHVQIELSLAGYAFDHAGTARTQTIDVAPVNVKVGLTNAVDIQFVFTPYQRVVGHDGTTRTALGGFGDDSQVRVKINLWGNDGGRTAFAVMPFVKAPTGSGGLGNGHVEGGLILPLAIDLPAGFSLGTMAEFDLVYDETGHGGRGDYGIDIVHSATVGHALIGKLEGYVEYIGVVPRSNGGGYRATASSGVTYTIVHNWNIDGGGTLGLSGRTDDVTLFIGTSLRF